MQNFEKKKTFSDSSKNRNILRAKVSEKKMHEIRLNKVK